MSSWSVYFVRFVAVVRDRCWRWWFLGYRMQYSNTPTSTSTSTLGYKSSCNMTQAQPWSAIPPQSQASDECRRVLTHPPLGLNINFLYEYILVIDFFYFNNIFFFLKKQTHLYYYIHLSSKYDDLKRDTVNLKIPGSVWF